MACQTVSKWSTGSCPKAWSSLAFFIFIFRGAERIGEELMEMNENNAALIGANREINNELAIGSNYVEILDDGLAGRRQDDNGDIEEDYKRLEAEILKGDSAMPEESGGKQKRRLSPERSNLSLSSLLGQKSPPMAKNESEDKKENLEDSLLKRLNDLA